MGLFDYVYSRNLIYNQCWEDPAVDRRALDLGPADKVMVITSAGCNALDYALTGAKVVAVDANPRQNHLLALKIAGIDALDFESFFELFGLGGSARAVEIYRDALRDRLDPSARAFWDREIPDFDPARSRGRSFYYCGTSGLVALSVRLYLEKIADLRAALSGVLRADRLEEQMDIYRAEVRPRLLGDAVTRLVGSRGVLSLLGVPPAQRALVASRPGGFSEYLRGCLDHVMGVALLRDNYFWNVYLTGRYSRQSCPEYLKRDNFDLLKRGLAANVTLVTGTVTEALGRGESAITAFVLLDHMDWLVERPALLQEEWHQIFEKSARGARIIFRSGAPDASFLPPSVRARLAFDEPRAQALHRQDRVGTYGSFHLARLEPALG
jgi:S-adenosylmethionine-diacylglycerol 3-amino-3-carboxypropyl transferase